MLIKNSSERVGTITQNMNSVADQFELKDVSGGYGVCCGQAKL